MKIKKIQRKKKKKNKNIPQKFVCNYIVFMVMIKIHCVVKCTQLCPIFWTYHVYDMAAHIIKMIVIKWIYYLIVTSKNADIA